MGNSELTELQNGFIKLIQNRDPLSRSHFLMWIKTQIDGNPNGLTGKIFAWNFSPSSYRFCLKILRL